MSRWYEQCMAQMTWAKFGEPMTREWTSSLIDRAKSLGFDALIFGAQLGGHVPGHSKVAPPIPGMEGDVLGQLCEEGHAKSLRIVPYFMSTTGSCQIQVREHPDWIAMGPEGKARMALCYSSPFGDWMEALIRDLYTKYPLDGIMFDQLSAACYCQFCLENFRRQYGREMPREKQFARMAPGLVTLPGGPGSAGALRLSHSDGQVLLLSNPAGARQGASERGLHTELAVRAGRGGLRRVRRRIPAGAPPGRVAGVYARSLPGGPARHRLDGDVGAASRRLQLQAGLVVCRLSATFTTPTRTRRSIAT